MLQNLMNAPSFGQFPLKNVHSVAQNVPNHYINVVNKLLFVIFHNLFMIIGTLFSLVFANYQMTIQWNTLN